MTKEETIMAFERSPLNPSKDPKGSFKQYVREHFSRPISDNIFLHCKTCSIVIDLLKATYLLTYLFDTKI